LSGFLLITKMKKNLFLCFLFFAMMLSLSAQQARISIFEALSDTSKTEHGKVVLYQDPRLSRLIQSKITGVPYTANYIQKDGFRVQVFSDNTPRTARTDAYKIEDLIRAKRPTLPTYVVYQAPFWKVRVGDCSTDAEAQELRSFILSTFPEMKNETYIVREQVRIPAPY